jgi:hypothetical protein
LQEIIGRPDRTSLVVGRPLCRQFEQSLEGALLVVPSGTLVTVDDAVTIGADLAAAVAIVSRYRREMIVTGLLALETGASRVGQVVVGEPGGDLDLPLLDEMQPPVGILVTGDGLVGTVGCRGGRGIGWQVGNNAKEDGARDKGVAGDWSCRHARFLLCHSTIP